MHKFKGVAFFQQLQPRWQKSLQPHFLKKIVISIVYMGVLWKSIYPMMKLTLAVVFVILAFATPTSFACGGGDDGHSDHPNVDDVDYTK